MKKDEMIVEAETRPSVVFENTVFADAVAKMNDAEKCYIVLDGITVTNGDENGTSGCSQVIYLGTDNDGFFERMIKLALGYGTDELLYIKPEETAQMGYRVETKDSYLFDEREAHFLFDLSCTFIDEINISYEEATEHMKHES